MIAGWSYHLSKGLEPLIVGVIMTREFEEYILSPRRTAAVRMREGTAAMKWIKTLKRLENWLICWNIYLSALSIRNGKLLFLFVSPDSFPRTLLGSTSPKTPIFLSPLAFYF